MPRLLFGLCALACASFAAAAPLGAAGPPAQWVAVLVAGDNAQPVFDNAVDAMSTWLTAEGVPQADIHRLSASRTPRGAAEPATIERVLQRIAALQARPGQRCLVFITSHGQRGEGVYLAASADFLRPDALARALAAGCSAVPTVVIVSSCYSGSFAAGTMQAPNRVVLAAARPDRPSFGCQADRTYTVFDECLLGALQGAPTWRRVYQAGYACVTRHEREMAMRPSQPRASFGAAVRNLSVP